MSTVCCVSTERVRKLVRSSKSSSHVGQYAGNVFLSCNQQALVIFRQGLPVKAILRNDFSLRYDVCLMMFCNDKYAAATAVKHMFLLTPINKQAAKFACRV